MIQSRRRVLFVAEAVTLAHVTRPLVLAKALDPARYEVHLACAPGYERFIEGAPIRHWPLWSISPSQFMEALAKGKPIYDYSTLQHYIEDDLTLLDAVRPDLVVGDFRLSLAVSAAYRRCPYAAITNAHWSPYSSCRSFPLPEHPLIGLLGVALTSMLFRTIQPLVFRLHAKPLNRLRRRYGLTPLGSLQHAYTHGDYTLYADTPGLAPTRQLPDNHIYIGPLLWSPPLPPPDWWQALPRDKPLIYLTLGSSGQANLLPRLASILTDMPVISVIATAGRESVEPVPGRIWVAPYLPGTEVARRARLVVCNGGSASVYQALAVGVPVLGIVSNMDQHLTMRAVEKAGAGLLMRAGKFSIGKMREAVNTLLEKPVYRHAAQKLAEEFADYDAATRFREFVESRMK